MFTIERIGSLPKERPPTWRMQAITMCTFVMRMAREGWKDQAPFRCHPASAGLDPDIPEFGRINPNCWRTHGEHRLQRPAGTGVRLHQRASMRIEFPRGKISADVRVGSADGKVGPADYIFRLADKTAESGESPASHQRIGASSHCANRQRLLLTCSTPTCSRPRRRIGNARVVLLGEASHGTSEFYRMRARITQRLDRIQMLSYRGS